MRFIATIEKDTWKGTLTCHEDEAWRHALPLKRLESPDGVFPALGLPLHAPGDTHEGLAGAASAADIKALYDRVVLMREADMDEVAKLGHYLFDALLGDALWGKMEQKVEQANEHFLELALDFPADDLHLQRLNWELMRSARQFLVAQGEKLDVTITRLVAPRAQPDETDAPYPQPLDVPPRVLFVVGTALNEDKIRPAAELFSLLRQAQEGRAMSYRLLERATPTQLRATIADFKPQIVHFICHGEVVDGKIYLNLRTDDSDLPTRRSATAIRNDLMSGTVTPTVVVLSACFTGGPGGGDRAVLAGVHESAPFAADLVAQGIPIVIGMAGRVADITSRLFARRLTDAVVKGTPLTRATAVARQVAFADGGDPDSTIDWALPAVFLARNVSPLYQPLDAIASKAEWKRLEDWIHEFKDTPVFCGRETFLARFHRMLRPPEDERPNQVIAAIVATQETGYGRTRLLKELATQAFYSGDLPLLLTFTGDRPRDLNQLMLEFVKAIRHLRTDVLKLDRATDAQLPLYLKRDPGVAGLDSNLAEDLELSTGTFTADSAKRAIAADLSALLSDAQERHESLASGRLVVLLDDLDLYSDALIEAFLGGDLMGAGGFGTTDAPIPVVFTASRGGAQDPRFEALESGSLGWVDALTLGPFQPDGEDLRACQSVLLNPFQRPAIYPFPNIPYAYNDAVVKPTRELWDGFLRNELKGIPQAYKDPRLLQLAMLAESAQYLVKADDEERMNKLEKRL